MDVGLDAIQTGIRSTVSTVESLLSLPAVPTQDWFDRAAAALLSIPHTPAAIIVCSRHNHDGNAVVVEGVGVAGIARAQITTTIGRPRTESSSVEFAASHPALARLRRAAADPAFGWTPSLFNGRPIRSGAATALLSTTPSPVSPVFSRWTEFSPSDILLATIPVGLPQHGSSLLIELAQSSTDPVARQANALVLDAVLPVLAKRCLLSFASSPPGEAHCLTTREQAVLEQLVNGRSVRQIAEFLDRSAHTVHDHVKSLHRKLNASSRGGLVARALGHPVDAAEIERTDSLSEARRGVSNG